MSGFLSSGAPDRSPEPSSNGAAQPPAKAAFLRGVERRAAVLAELQCGDDATGDAAVAAAMRQFQAGAGGLPMEQWPLGFWKALLAQPGLRSHPGGSNGPEPIDALAGLDPGSRAALLLHLVAGLDETAAAAALGVAGPTYRLALRRSLPRGADGQADLALWRRLQQQVQQRLKHLPPPRLVRLGRNREAALGAPGREVATSRPAGRPRSPLLPLLWGVFGLCALGFAATFWMEGATGRGDGPQLPKEAPASRYGADAGRIAHRDFALLADPQGVALAEQLAFHSWLVDQLQDGATTLATDARPSVEPDVAAPVRLPAPATAADPLLADFKDILPRLQPAQRARLQLQAARWSGWSPAERLDFTTRATQWDALSPSAQGVARERYRAWLALEPRARVQVDAAARRYRALPPTQQQTLRANFEALDRSLRRGWLLGPGLGADYADLQPLLAQVPAAEHAELLRVLRAMTVTQRDDLAVLVQRTPPQERARLRRELVSTAAGNRDDWLWNRLHR